ncbi:hypothetical protein L484_020745 [Morus notabilis]|uniref:Uncharacterized protein n=1 Tax=Morus notabilis TaxID=981085 RepID=W9QM30_9ROSA|nr:hypothetical protein L484_020745 [Morus notabilis]
MRQETDLGGFMRKSGGGDVCAWARTWVGRRTIRVDLNSSVMSRSGWLCVGCTHRANFALVMGSKMNFVCIRGFFMET